MRQGRWLEFIKDYDCVIHYHLGNANVVVGTLGSKSTSSLTNLQVLHHSLLLELRRLSVDLSKDR